MLVVDQASISLSSNVNTQIQPVEYSSFESFQCKMQIEKEKKKYERCIYGLVQCRLIGRLAIVPMLLLTMWVLLL